jgi:CO/xanthine dehydrogenase Mo-binding subunit
MPRLAVGLPFANAVANATGFRLRDLPLAADRVFRALVDRSS